MILDQALRWSGDRREGKPLLTIPTLSQLNDSNFQDLVCKQLTACAMAIKARGDVYSASSGSFSKTYTGLYRWRRYSGLIGLVEWNPVEKAFTHFDIASLCRWLGCSFDLVDSTGMAFGEPHRATTARISETLCSDGIDLPWASWALTDQFRREGK